MQVFTGAHFGTGTSSILMDESQCDGSETDILHYSFAGWGSKYCSYCEDASVACSKSFKY